MNIDIIVVLAVLAGMIFALIKDWMRPGMVLFSVVVVFLCCGIISPGEALEGFSNKGMITVALLFLVSEGIRQSGALNVVIKKLLPEKRTTLARLQIRMLPAVAAISAFLNNTPVVVIFAPIVKNWAEKMRMQPTKLLMPLSFATILGGMCTLIGTSTNLVVYGMVIESGHEPFSMFQLAKIGLPIAIVGILYMVIFSKKLLPRRRESLEEDTDEKQEAKKHEVQVVLGPRFPGINMTAEEFGFQRHYGARVLQIKRAGIPDSKDTSGEMVFKEGDTLVLEANDSFISTWGDSRVFLMVSGMDRPEEAPECGRRKRWLALILLVVMITGATIGELPFMRKFIPGLKLDMFFFVCITTVIMAWVKLFPPKRYTKYISWDILITIACAFGISKAMENSGFADAIAGGIIGIAKEVGPHVLLAIIYLITNLFTELITNNAAAALAFPICISTASQLGVDPMPFFMTICIAASASFSTPIGYQTNLIVQGFGNYKFTDFAKFGLPLNIIAFLLTVFLVPLIWKF